MRTTIFSKHLMYCLAMLIPSARLMGNFNVVWELKDDVSRGSYLLNMPKGKLSAEERNGIAELMNALSGIPDSVLITANTEDANRKAMNNPCWIPLRKEAKKLLQVLRPQIKKGGSG